VGIFCSCDRLDAIYLNNFFLLYVTVKARHYVANPNHIQVGDYVLAQFETREGKVEQHRDHPVSPHSRMK
jgi:hypothetical protein